MEEIGISQSEPMVKDYRPTDEQALRRYEINLRFLDRGMLIRVGCKEIAFSSNQEGIDALNKYIANPWDEQNKWEQSFN